jgi:hypothetical protein
MQSKVETCSHPTLEDPGSHIDVCSPRFVKHRSPPSNFMRLSCQPNSLPFGRFYPSNIIATTLGRSRYTDETGIDTSARNVRSKLQLYSRNADERPRWRGPEVTQEASPSSIFPKPSSATAATAMCAQGPVIRYVRDEQNKVLTIT